jgi:DNA repair exonuclease SbcCD nuclease subunit
LRFRFIHAADLHLDSPLQGLSRKSQDFSARVDDASRQAFDNLIALAIAEQCRLIVIAGDVFDGQWKSYHTGLFFAERMRRLSEHGVRVVMILGNHDAANPFAGRLELSGNVTVLPSNRPGSAIFEDIGAAVHGQSFPQREVTENIALGYPAPVGGLFNIGLLHTAGSGREGHASYAPCSVEQLANHGYAYWALGHIHTRETLSTTPHILFPGNLQSRSIREPGAKGASLVTVEDGIVTSVEHRSLDVVRFAVETIDVAGLNDREGLFAAIRASAEGAIAAADGRALALRLNLAGAAALHADLVTNAQDLREEIETILASVDSDIWLEKLCLRTSPPPALARVDPTVAGGLKTAIEGLAQGNWLEERLAAKLAEIKTKLPAGAHADRFFAQMKAEGAERARTLALALIEKGGADAL